MQRRISKKVPKLTLKNQMVNRRKSEQVNALASQFARASLTGKTADFSGVMIGHHDKGREGKRNSLQVIKEQEIRKRKTARITEGQRKRKTSRMTIGNENTI